MASKAIFLDRDGVLIRERGDYTWLLEDMIVNDGVVDGLQILQRAGYIFIVISNQSGISKNLYSKKDADYLHMHLERFFAIKNIQINEFYYCPHHPTVSTCICRKPDSLLLEKAIARFGIDAGNSWFIGDADRDIEAGVKAGVQTLKLPVNGSLIEAAEFIIRSTNAPR
jgi:D-glycero-D-manno-heptose 1,7-bisphosphate phosphatase